jgi:hypothetical protein
LIYAIAMTATKAADADRAKSDRAELPPLIVAKTRDGSMMPVIDVTDPRFAVPDDPDSLHKLRSASDEEERRNRRIPKFIMRRMLKSAAKRSRLLQAIFAGNADFLNGITTYAMKLGADNLPAPYGSAMDRRVAASPHLTLLRLRTQQVARLTADGLASELTAAQTAPLHLINIAGGPAADSMNALTILNRRGGNLLRRRITIHVLDPDEGGPFFGRNALAALAAEGGPLAGLDVTFDHRRYDWNEPAPLEALLRDIAPSHAVVAASSEGGLFEYGSDDAIVANLEALRAGGVRLIAGSVTSNDEARRRMITASRFKIIPRGLEGFAPLAKRGDYRIAQTETAHLSDQVLLTPS